MFAKKPQTNQLFWLSLLKKLAKNRKRGFSLVEKIISLAIGSIITLGLVSMISQFVQSNQQEAAFIATEEETQGALKYIIEDLREAVYVYPNFSEDLLAGLPDFTTVEGLGPNTEPILIFWRTQTVPEDQLPNSCAVGGGISTEVKAAECRLLMLQRNMYTLVVYLQSTDQSDKWSGKSRIVRYALPKYTNPATLSLAQGFVDPAKHNNFITWPLDEAGTNHQTDGDLTGSPNPSGEGQPRPVVLADYIDTPDRSEFHSDSKPDLPRKPPNCPDDYSRVPSNKTNYNSFFACVRNTDNNLGTNQDIMVYLRGNAAGRDQLVKTRDYIPALEAQVTLRGVIDKFD